MNIPWKQTTTCLFAVGILLGYALFQNENLSVPSGWAFAHHDEKDFPVHAEHECDHDHDHGSSQGCQHPLHADKAPGQDNHDHDHHHDHDHDHERSIALTQEQITRFGIKTSPVEHGQIHIELRAPGEIKIITDRMAHIVPRSAGIVRDVLKSLGDSVHANEDLAWIESDELVEAKLNFYARQTEVECCEIEFPRAKEIFENTTKLLKLLESEASESEIALLDDLEMGAYKGTLLTAYASYESTQTIYEREHSLYTQEITSEQEFLEAETLFKQAKAEFFAAMDTARFETFIALTQATQKRQIGKFDAIAAEKQLRLRGALDEDIAALKRMVPSAADLIPCLCSDPNCRKGTLPSMEETLGNQTQFGWYTLRAPFDGTVIERHLVLGESVDKSSEVFIIADLSNVWVDLSISQDVLSSVQEGLPVTIKLPNGIETDTTIEFVGPLVAPNTRMALARTTLENLQGRFRPGTFVDAKIRVSSATDVLSIPSSSIQWIDDKPCVFLKTNDCYEIRVVEIGATDRQRTEILRGLSLGDLVVSQNAFHLKAQLTQAAGGAHACHGHSH